MKSGEILALDRFDPVAPLGPQLLTSLRGHIVRTELAPGTRLSEKDIAAFYRTSRQPVREAFIRLAEEGLLEIRPQRGTFVRKISEDGVRVARFVREAIEADVARLAAVRGDARAVEDLNALVSRQRRTPAGDAAGFIALDEAFHRRLADAAGMVGTWSVLEQIKWQMDRVRYLAAGEIDRRVVVDQHLAIVDAVAAGDVDLAERSMRIHLRKLLADLPAIVAAHSGYFEGDVTP